MAESNNTELEVHREMMTLSSRLWKNKTRVCKKAPKAQTSKQEIKADVHKILEQFLKKKQLNDNEEEEGATGFPRKNVENVTKTYGSGSTNISWEEYEYPPWCAGCPSEANQSIPTGSNRFPTDNTTNFTFIDEDEHNVERSDKDNSKRSNSPPLSDEIPVCRAGRPQRIKSGTESETDDTDYYEVISPNDVEKTAEGTARPAVGLQGLTFGTESDTDDIYHEEESISRKKDIERRAEGTARPAMGRQRLVSRTESKTDDTDYEEYFIYRKKDKKRILVGKPMSAVGLKSGLESETDDTDYDEEVISRKKVKANKSASGLNIFYCKNICKWFKHTIYLIYVSITLTSGAPAIESDTDDTDYDEGLVIIKRWKSRKKEDIDSSVNKRRNVVQNVHTHNYSHVEQHHYTNGNKSGMLMENEVWECKDVAGRSEHKHGERHSNIRESKEQTSDDEIGFIGRLRKMTFFKKSMKDKSASPTSKSMRLRHATSGRTSSEKDRLYTAVAEKLAHIGDHYKATSPLSDSTRSSVDHTATRRINARTPNLPGVDERGSDGLTALERQLIDTLREVGDSFQHKLSPDAFKEIAKQAMYHKFQEVVDKETGPGNSWDQIATVFYLTKKVVTMAGVGGAVALQVKDLAAEYVADKFASWIVDQGGWDTFLDSDSDLD